MAGCKDLYNATIYPPISSYSNNSGSGFDIRRYGNVRLPETAYPAVTYVIPLTILVKPNYVNGTHIPCRIRVQVQSSSTKIQYYKIVKEHEINISSNSNLIQASILLLVVDEKIRLMIFLLLLMMITFYFYDLGIYIGIDTNNPRKGLRKVQNTILTNAQLIYTINLPFIIYFLSQEPNMSIPLVNNLPMFLSFSMIFYLFSHSMSILLKDLYKKDIFHFSYHYLNALVLTVLIFFINLLYNQSTLPLKIVDATYIFLLLRNIIGATIALIIENIGNR